MTEFELATLVLTEERSVYEHPNGHCRPPDYFPLWSAPSWFSRDRRQSQEGNHGIPQADTRAPGEPVTKLEMAVIMRLALG